MKESKKSIQPDPKDIEANKLLASLSYFGLLCFVPLFLKKDSDFAQFHAKQGFLLLALMIVAAMISWIPIINALLGLFILYLVIFGIYNAWSGRYWQLPILGKYVNKLNL